MSNSSPEGFSYFAEIAASYDRVQSVLSPPYERGLEMIVELVPFDPDEPFDFVDLGCGTRGTLGAGAGKLWPVHGHVHRQ